MVYNGVLCGVSLSGDRFFYVNPLDADGCRQFNHGHSTRFPWTGCACCPVNIARFIPSVPGFAYAAQARTVYAAFYLPGSAEIPLEGGTVKLRQITEYPWSGRVRFEVLETDGSEWALKLRIPGWAEGRPVPGDLYRYTDKTEGAHSISVNGQNIRPAVERGFADISRRWNRGDTVELSLPMPVRRVAAHEKVAANTGRSALERGPLVYCVEGVDHEGNVHKLYLPESSSFSAQKRPGLPGGVTALHGSAFETFYREDGTVAERPAEITAIPYYAWCHRGSTSMQVWLPLSPAGTQPLMFPTPAGRAIPTASHTHSADTPWALNDQVLPERSDDTSIRRFTWWDHKGSSEWVQYDCKRPERISAVEVYWFDDESKGGGCRVPESCKLTWFDGSQWYNLETEAPIGLQKDRFNRASFKPVTVSSIRLEVKLHSGFSGGILEWRLLP